MRYFMLDKITELTPGKTITGIKCVTWTEEVLHDHFPGYPILPGALLTESMAQLCGLLVEQTFNTDPTAVTRRAVLGQIEKMKFYKMSTPGDRLVLTARIESMLEDAAQVGVEVTCDGELRAKGRLTLVMIQLDIERINQQRLDTYRVWTRDLKNCPPLR